jgi:hypothetical protein
MAPKGRQDKDNASKAKQKGRVQAESNTAVPLQIESSSSSRPSTAEQDCPPISTEAVPIIIHGQKYYKAEDLARKGKGRKKTSHIWKNGFEIIHAESGSKHFYCRLCLDKEVDLAYKPLRLSGTSPIHAHFRSKHNLNQAGNVIECGDRSSSRAPTTSPAPEFVFKSVLERFKFLLVQWIVFAHISFLQIENKYFRDLLTFLSSSFASFLPSRNTFRNWVLEEFKTQKKRLRKELKKARSNIHFSFDLWTSSNFYAMIAIVAHFIDSNGCRQTKLLAIRQLKGEHSGENIAEAILQVIKEYRISKRVGFFVLDNASSNDVAVDHILCSLYPGMSNIARKRRRLRCLAHIINLVAKAFLLGPKADDVDDELFLAQRHSNFQKMGDIWRKHGPLGRLQNLIRHIRLTPQRRQKFKSCQVDVGSWKEFNKVEV